MGLLEEIKAYQSTHNYWKLSTFMREKNQEAYDGQFYNLKFITGKMDVWDLKNIDFWTREKYIRYKTAQDLCGDENSNKMGELRRIAKTVSHFPEIERWIAENDSYIDRVYYYS